MSIKTIVVDDSAKGEILEMFGKTVDKNGYIVEKNDPTQRVLSPEGDEMTLNRFAGITKGSLAFVRSDIISLMNLSDRVQ